VGKKINVTVRLAPETLERIDGFVEQFYPLVETRVAMTRILITSAIAAIDAKKIPFTPEGLRRFLEER
jgi:hypothetical protein